MIEQWKPLVYNNHHYDTYYVSNFGNVKRIRDEKTIIMSPFKIDSGHDYLRIKIYNDVKEKYVNIRMHRAVAEVFLDNPDGKRTVNHKDGNKSNNLVTNLEYATHSENSKHAHRTGLAQNPTGKKRPVQITKGKVVQKFSSVTLASEYIGCNQSYLAAVCRGKFNTAKGWQAEYI